MKLVLKCKQCGKHFKSNRSTRKFCSRKCFYIWHGLNTRSINHPRYKGKIKKYCKYCGKEFEVYESAKVGITFCSHKCSSKWWSENIRGNRHPNWKPKVKKCCLECNKEFEILQSRTKGSRGKFCSKICLAKWRGKNLAGQNSLKWKPKVTKHCKYCNKEFEVLKSAKWGVTFCSNICYGKWISENKSGRKSHRWKQVKRKCMWCEKEFTVYPARVANNRGKFCSKDCLAAWQSKNVCGKKHPSWIDGRSFKPYCSKFNSGLKEMVRERDGRVCQLCNTSEKENVKKLDVHHIHYDKENCYPDLISLCAVCNSKTNKKNLRKYYEWLFMNKLNSRGLLFWTGFYLVPT